jgi:hypothetical protein
MSNPLFGTINRVDAIEKIHEVMNLIDDGYHNQEIVDLTKVSNKLYYELPGQYQELIKSRLGMEEEPSE